jgi:hypothetical protein
MINVRNDVKLFNIPQSAVRLKRKFVPFCLFSNFTIENFGDYLFFCLFQNMIKNILGFNLFFCLFQDIIKKISKIILFVSNFNLANVLLIFLIYYILTLNYSLIFRALKDFWKG